MVLLCANLEQLIPTGAGGVLVPRTVSRYGAVEEEPGFLLSRSGDPKWTSVKRRNKRAAAIQEGDLRT